MGGVAGQSRWRLTPQVTVLLLAAGVAWVAIVAWTNAAGAMSGAMGLELPEFLVAWTVMMAAMMLPSVAPVASLYARSITGHRAVRLVAFTAGYLVVWASAGVAAFAIGGAVGSLTAVDPAYGVAAGAAAFVACGVYQLTPLKSRCLRHCRSPIALLFKYSAYRGASRDLRAGLHHGAYCLACCWGLMVVLLALGAMSITPMAILAAVVIIEKLWSRGELFSRLVGIAAFGLAAATLWFPALTAGFSPPM